MGSIITPVFSTTSPSGTPISSSLVVVDNYVPINYTPISTNVGGNLGGLDAALGVLSASLNSINATGIVVTTVTPTYYTPGTTALPSFLSAIDTQFGKIDLTHPRDFGSQLLVDGDSGKFNASVTNMTATGTTASQDNTVFHDPTSGSSYKTLSTSTATKTITHTTVIAFKADLEYELAAYVYVPAADYPDGAVVSMTVTSGTGIVRPTKTLTVSSGTAGKWTKVSTRYIPDSNQSRNIAITVTGFTNAKILYVDDVIVSVVPGKRLGYLAPYSIVSLTNLSEVYNRTARSFVYEGGAFTTSGVSMNVTVSAASYVINGRAYFQNSSVVVATATKDNYIFYNSFNDQYVVKPVTVSATAPKADDGEIVLGYVTTNGAGATGSTDQRVMTPYTGSNLAALSIATGHIIDAAVTDAKMSVTGVTAASYIFGNFTVTAAGRLTAASSAVTLTSVYSNNLLVYDSGTSKFVNTSTLTLNLNSASLADNSTLNSPAFTLRGYYDSDAGAGITAVAYNAVFQHIMTSVTPRSKLHLSIGDTTFWKFTNEGIWEVFNSTASPAAIADTNQVYSANVTIGVDTKSVLHIINEHEQLIKLYAPNDYVFTYATAAYTLNAYTTDTESSAYTGLATGEAGTPYAKLTDINALRVAYENLRTSYDNLIQVVRGMGGDLQEIGLLGTP